VVSDQLIDTICIYDRQQLPPVRLIATPDVDPERDNGPGCGEVIEDGEDFILHVRPGVWFPPPSILSGFGVAALS
jgi:hypothetical protein